MKWFRRIVWRVCKRAWEDNEEFEKEMRHAISSNSSAKPLRNGRGTVSRLFDSDDDHSPQLRASSMNFRLYACVGGHILETSVYNQKEDEHQHTLYMIKDEDDFAKQVSQSIMLEMMKQ